MENDTINLFATIYGVNYLSTKLVIHGTKSKNRLVQGNLPQDADQMRRAKASKAINPLMPGYDPGLPLTEDRLELRFGHRPNTSQGLVFGYDLGCDIVLPMSTGADRYHCAITFNDAGRLILKDLGSSAGTSVEFEQQTDIERCEDLNYRGNSSSHCQLLPGAVPLEKFGGMDSGRSQVRRNFTWIISGNPFLDLHDPKIIIHIGKAISLRVVPVSHDINSGDFLAKTRRFREGRRESTRLMDSTAQRIVNNMMSSSFNTSQYGINTPITVQSMLGRGGFGEVAHHWDVSSGLMYAVKTLINATGDRSLEIMWEEEIEATKRCQHDNIISYVNIQDSNSPNNLPRMSLEYAPGGSLRRQEQESIITVMESGVAHRDIKLENIVVMRRLAHGKIHVKLCDFGLSKDFSDTLLESRKGTLCYMAPELLKRRPYNETIDLFSLTITVASYVLNMGCPNTKLWQAEIRSKVTSGAIANPCKLFAVLESMVSGEPSLRETARRQLTRASQLTSSDIIATGQVHLGLEPPEQESVHHGGGPGSGMSTLCPNIQPSVRSQYTATSAGRGTSAPSSSFSHSTYRRDPSSSDSFRSFK